MEPTKPPKFNLTEDFSEVYANNINFAQTIFDLKILFGQINQSIEPAEVDQHTAVTISWPEAKLFLHFLNVQIVAFEAGNGKIHLPQSILPPAPVPPTEEIVKAEPQSMEIYQAIKSAHEAFLKRI